jgi:hypothetical protein
LEWISTFAAAFLFWNFLFYELINSYMSAPAAAAVSALYACGLVYSRLYPVTRCRKCSSLLPLVREEISRRHVHDEEKCVETERGGVEYGEHFIDLYNRVYQVDIVKFRCVKCKATWEEVEHSPASDYRFVRTITVKD